MSVLLNKVINYLKRFSILKTMNIRAIKARDIGSFVYHYATTPRVSIPVTGFVAANIASVVCGISDGYAYAQTGYYTSHIASIAATNTFSTGALGGILERKTKSVIGGCALGVSLSGLEYGIGYAIGYTLR